MTERTNQPTRRELRRRVLRWQKHKLPRKTPLPFWQRLTAWMMLILSVALMLVVIAQR